MVAVHPIDTVKIQSGSGYFGSTYVSTVTEAGQWYADDTPIAGETGTTYVLTADNEGKGINYRTNTGQKSNKVTMFTPDKVSGLVGWWDASRSDLMTLVGSNVSEWVSKVGGYKWLQATDSIRPSYNATGRNSKPAIMVDLGEYMTADSATPFPAGTVTSHTFAAAWLSAPATGEWHTLVQWGTANSGSRSMLVRNSTGGPGISVGTAATDTFVTSPLWLNSDRIMSGVIKSTGTDLMVDGQYSLVRSASINSLAATATRLFGHMYTTGRWRGSCHELMNYNVELSAANRQKVEGYIAHKWGYTSLLPSGHPYKTTPPFA